MSSPLGSLVIPERSYLSAQAAATICKAIQDGRWKEFLPSERRLCEILRVSRPTIRAAVHVLAEEGWLKIRQGRRSELLCGPAKRRPQPSRLVVLVTHESAANLSHTAYQSISEMRSHLAEHGFTIETLICPAHGVAAQRRKLELFMRQNAVFCCVLLSVSRELQLWIAEHAIPALVLGSCHPGVKMPSLDIDYRSVCRHAAGTFLGKGHREIALIVPDSGVAGDLASEQGFHEALAQRASADEARGTIVRHNGTLEHINARLDELFASPRRPTALLVAKPQHTFFVMTYLLRHGLKVPSDVSLIARDHETLFGNAVSQYTFEKDTFARRFSHLMLQMVGQGCLAPEPSLMFPKYSSGGTVKALA